MSDVSDDIDVYRQWRDEHADATLRHRTMASEMAWAWGGIDLLLREVDRRIDPDEMDDDQTAIYEAGYIAGQRAVAQQLRLLAGQLDAPESPPTKPPRYEPQPDSPTSTWYDR